LAKILVETSILYIYIYMHVRVCKIEFM